MSQAHVGMVIETLLTDENLRIRFALERIETIADLCVRGVELTGDEIDLFCQTDARLWFLGDEVKREWRRSATCGLPDGRRPIGAVEKPSCATMDEIITRSRAETRRTQVRPERKEHMNRYIGWALLIAFFFGNTSERRRGDQDIREAERCSRRRDPRC